MVLSVPEKRFMDRFLNRCVLVGFCCLLLSAPVQVLEAQQEQNRYNVLFIAVDDLRPELGAYGRSYVNTPSIDRLAEAGVTFTNHYVPAPTCGVSRYALLTGRSPAQSGVRHGNKALYQGDQALSQERKEGAQSMPELFRRSGYHTVNIGKISHTPDGKVYSYDGSGSGRPEVPHAWDELPTPYGPWEYGWGAFFAYPDGRHREDGTGLRDLMNFEAQKDTDLPDGMLAETAVEKLGELSQTEEPFFMGLGFYKPHLPFVAPEEDRKAVENWNVPPTPHPQKLDSAYWSGSWEFYSYDMPFETSKPLSKSARMKTRKAYLACVRYVDRQVGTVLDALEAEGLSDSTIVVLWGDHGWYLGEYAQWGKHTLLERATRSPLIIYHPDLKNPGRTVDAPVDTIDLYPTLVDLARPKFRKTHWPLDGVSLRPLLEGKASSVKPGAMTYWEDEQAVRTRDWRLITSGNPGSWSNTELYDLRNGPESGEEVSDEHPDVTRKLQRYLRKRVTKRK